jgi:hypothetical protein
MTSIRYRLWIIPILALILSGCNAFDPIDTSMSLRSEPDAVTEGNLYLESGDFTRAFDVFSPLYIDGKKTAEVVRGYGEATAGLAGFRLLPVLNAVQNEAFGNNQAPILFRTRKLISSRTQLETAVKILMSNPVPERTDYLARALMRIPTVVGILVEKYDTDRNGKLTDNDNITFETNDKKLPTWPELYTDLVSGPSTRGQTLEETFLDLARGLDGRGATWTFTTPVNGTRYSGTYSDINKATILAVGNLTERLIAANRFYNVSPASFAATLTALDGSDSP